MADLSYTQTAAEDIYVSGTAVIAGSIAITSSTALVQTGSVAITSSIVLGISGIALAGSFAMPNPWGGIGSALVTNTVPVTNALDEEGRRAPNYGFSGALLTTSGLTANIFIPAAGSKALLKSYAISSDVANFVSIKFSGNTTVPVSQFFIPASGTVIQNLIGAEPSGAADMPIAAGVGVAGNIYISVFARSIP